MQFSSIIGQEKIKQSLITAFNEGRVAHAQLFLGPEGCGSFALTVAFAQFINCNDRSENDSCGLCPSCVKFEKFAHPDLHFYFPTTKTDSQKKDPMSSLYLEEWREYLDLTSGYPTQSGWNEHLKVGNRQGMIRVADGTELIGKLSLTPYEAEYKVVIIWSADKMNPDTSNKLLKTFEEPPDKTIIFLIAERYELILPTVRSRAQIVKVPQLKDTDIIEGLQFKANLDQSRAKELALLSSGNWNRALYLSENRQEEGENFIRFRQWLRYCFSPKDYVELNKFNGELARLGRENQKIFLQYGLDMVHNSMLHNQQQEDLVKKSGEELEFSAKLAPLINNQNQVKFYQLFNEAIYHVERNANPGIMFSDLSFQLIDLLAEARKQKAKS